MCELACDQTSDWIMVDPWEAIQTEYQPTALVLDHVAHEVNDILGGVAPYAGAPRSEYRRAHVSLLSGSDLLQTMSASISRSSLGTWLTTAATGRVVDPRS
jgi:nicotinamide mononucleotide adenylyltransferase